MDEQRCTRFVPARAVLRLAQLLLTPSVQSWIDRRWSTIEVAKVAQFSIPRRQSHTFCPPVILNNSRMKSTTNEAERMHQRPSPLIYAGVLFSSRQVLSSPSLYGSEQNDCRVSVKMEWESSDSLSLSLSLVCKLWGNHKWRKRKCEISSSAQRHAHTH